MKRKPFLRGQCSTIDWVQLCFQSISACQPETLPWRMANRESRGLTAGWLASERHATICTMADLVAVTHLCQAYFPACRAGMVLRPSPIQRLTQPSRDWTSGWNWSRIHRWDQPEELQRLKLEFSENWRGRLFLKLLAVWPVSTKWASKGPRMKPLVVMEEEFTTTQGC